MNRAQDMQLPKPISGGKIIKGGINLPPKTPKPNFSPPSQYPRAKNALPFSVGDRVLVGPKLDEQWSAGASSPPSLTCAGVLERLRRGEAFISQAEDERCKEVRTTGRCSAMSSCAVNALRELVQVVEYLLRETQR